MCAYRMQTFLSSSSNLRYVRAFILSSRKPELAIDVGERVPVTWQARGPTVVMATTM